jgi:hypothetical protein
MKKIKLFPQGYDPQVAKGPPTSFHLKLGIKWTEEETKKAKELETKAEIIEVEKLPPGRWYRFV